MLNESEGEPLAGVQPSQSALKCSSNMIKKRSKAARDMAANVTQSIDNEDLKSGLRRSTRRKIDAMNSSHVDWRDEENSAHAKVLEEIKESKRLAKAASKKARQSK